MGIRFVSATPATPGARRAGPARLRRHAPISRRSARGQRRTGRLRRGEPECTRASRSRTITARRGRRCTATYEQIHAAFRARTNSATRTSTSPSRPSSSFVCRQGVRGATRFRQAGPVRPPLGCRRSSRESRLSRRSPRVVFLVLSAAEASLRDRRTRAGNPRGAIPIRTPVANPLHLRVPGAIAQLEHLLCKRGWRFESACPLPPGRRPKARPDAHRELQNPVRHDLSNHSHPACARTDEPLARVKSGSAGRPAAWPLHEELAARGRVETSPAQPTPTTRRCWCGRGGLRGQLIYPDGSRPRFRARPDVAATAHRYHGEIRYPWGERARARTSTTWQGPDPTLVWQRGRLMELGAGAQSRGWDMS